MCQLYWIIYSKLNDFIERLSDTLYDIHMYMSDQENRNNNIY